MRKPLLTLLLLSGVLLANNSETTTHTSFETEVAMGEDKYGNAIYDRAVKIDTQNFKVDNFWKKFSFSGEGQNSMDFNTISKTGTVRISVEATSICTMYDELDIAGCSGQKPFLINDEALSSPLNADGTITLMFQKNYDEGEIVYVNNDASTFYPLDIQRSEKYYKPVEDKKFNSFFARMFNGFFNRSDDGESFFSRFFNYKVKTVDGTPDEDIRQRYITNITAGIEQKYLLEKEDNVLTTALNQPVSLLHYSEIEEQAGSCRLFFFKYSADSKFCGFMSRMPFMRLFSRTEQAVSYKIDTIQTDTENSLLAFASAYNDVDVTTVEGQAVSRVEEKSTGFFSKMRCFFFGCSSDITTISEPVITTYDFTQNNNKPINITLAVTNDGKSIDDFKTFKLNKMNSISNAQQWCSVELPEEFHSFTDGWNRDRGGWFGADTYNATFIPTEDKNVMYTNDLVTEDYCYKSGWGGGRYERDSNNECDRSSHERSDEAQNADSGMKNTDWWLNYCDDAMQTYLAEDSTRTETVEECSTDKASMFGKMLGKKDTTTCVQVPATITTPEGYIVHYVNNSQRGLSLDLEPVTLDTSSSGVTLRYKLISTQ